MIFTNSPVCLWLHVPIQLRNLVQNKFNRHLFLRHKLVCGSAPRTVEGIGSPGSIKLQLLQWLEDVTTTNTYTNTVNSCPQ